MRHNCCIYRDGEYICMVPKRSVCKYYKSIGIDIYMTSCWWNIHHTDEIADKQRCYDHLFERRCYCKQAIEELEQEVIYGE